MIARSHLYNLASDGTATRTKASFLIEAGALRAGVVQQTLADLSPDRVSPLEASGVCLLNFHDPLAAAAGDAQHVTAGLR